MFFNRLKALIPEATEAYWKIAICYVYWTLGMPETAEHYFFKHIATLSDDKEFSTFCYCEIAKMWRHYGDATKACSYYSKLTYKSD